MASQQKIAMAKSVSKVGLWTFGSRVLGLIRDSMVARIFGVGMATDAFMFAFTIPNLLRRLLAEGALSVAFVPVFTESITQKKHEESEKTFQIIFTSFSIFLVGVSIIGIFLSPWIVKVFAPGFEADQYALTTRLTQWMFPFIFFTGSSAVVMGILNALNAFFAPAAAPIFLNLMMIGAILFFSPFFQQPIFALAIGVILGGMAQWVLQIVRAYQLGFRIIPKFQLFHQDVKRIFKLLAPTVFGVAVYHLNILVSRALASLLPQGSVTYLYYSDRLLEFPLGIFAISIATVALPQLTREASETSFERLKEILFFSLKLVSFICVPAMIGLIVLRVPIISLLFQYGHFTTEDVWKLAQVFLTSALGLWAVAGLRVSVQSFYSLGDVRTPVKVALISFTLNPILGFLLMKIMGASGLTLASSISAWVQWILLFYFLGHKIGKLPIIPFVKSIMPMLVAALVMGLVLYPFAHYYAWFLAKAVLIKILYVLGAIAIGAGIYTFLAYLLGVKELKSIAYRVLMKFRKMKPEKISENSLE